MKKKILIGLGILILVVGLAIGGLYFYNSKKGNDSFGYIILKINPELMLSFDENNIVIDIKQLNDDAKIFKSGDLIGLDLENAISKVIDVALANGYLEDGIMNIIGISNFSGFSLEQAKTFIKNKGVSAYEPSLNSSDDVLRDFGIDCDALMYNDITDINDVNSTHLMICNAYAVTTQQRIQEENEKYEKYHNCMMNGSTDCEQYNPNPGFDSRPEECRYLAPDPLPLCPKGTELNKSDPNMYYGLDKCNYKSCFACPEGGIPNEEYQSCTFPNGR